MMILAVMVQPPFPSFLSAELDQMQMPKRSLFLSLSVVCFCRSSYRCQSSTGNDITTRY